MCDVKLINNDKHLAVKGVITDSILSRAQLSFVNIELTEEPVLNERPQDQFWISCLKTFPELSPMADLLWNVRVWKDVINFATVRGSLGPDEDVHALAEAVHGRRLTPVDIDIVRSLFRLMTEDTSRMKIDEEEQPRSLQSEFRILFERSGAIPDLRQLCISTLEEQAVLSKIYSDDRLKTMFHNLTASCRYQIVFRTASGKLGMAPYTVREGDEVFMYVGSYAPAVIRSVGVECYQWIASAYIQGAMAHDVFPDDESRLRYYIFE